MGMTHRFPLTPVHPTRSADLSSSPLLTLLTPGTLRARAAALRLAGLLLLGSACLWGCGPDADSSQTDSLSDSQRNAAVTIDTSLPTTTDTPIGLAFEIENGVGAPIKVRAGQTFFVNQIDMRVFLDTSADRGVSDLSSQGDYASLCWDGVQLADEEFVILPNPDGTFTRRRFYRDASWMNQDSEIQISQVDASGRKVGGSLVLHTGADDRRKNSDSFFIRRLRAIQWTYDCPSLQSCTGASHFQEEALVELRSTQKLSTFRMDTRTTALRVSWTLKPGTSYTVPVTQVAAPPYDYNFRVDLTPLTPPGAGGFYAPGTDLTIQTTLRDGSGTRLHPAGALPSYNEVNFGPNEAGIYYYRAFFDPSTTYYRRKHRERNMAVQIVGPVQDEQPIRTVATLEQFLAPNDTLQLGLPARDGWYAEGKIFPSAYQLFGGAFDPTHADWNLPVSDTFTYHLPADAKPGTYLVTLKSRRVYLGQDIPVSKTIKIQVGTAAETFANLNTGPCSSCHSGGGVFLNILHANDNRAACAGCHVPLGFELEGPIPVRVHFIHSRSNRFDAPLAKCSSCHLNVQGIQRTSKSACLSCHKSYPSSHVQQFGPIESMYVGGNTDSFGQCTSTCHTNHPQSNL